MRLLILLTILVVLSCQTTNIGHLGPSNPLQENYYTIVYNNLQNQHINGVPVYFHSSTQIAFQGCNSNTGSYELNGWQFKALGFVSTKIYCPIDNDSEIGKLFTDSTRITLTAQGKVNFYKEKTLLLTLRQIAGEVTFNPLAGRSLFIKQTNLNVDSIVGTEVNFSEQKVSFKGCNSNWASYVVRNNNRFRITSLWGSTLMACQKDNDSLITRLFSNSRHYTLSSKGDVSFFNSEGLHLLTLGPKALDISPFLGKKYVIAESSLNNKAIIGTNVGFTNQAVSFKGCNNNKGSYVIPSPNKINVGQLWAATKMACTVDFDDSIRKLFIQSKRFQISSADGSVTFFDQKSKLTLRLKIKQEIQPLPQFIGLKGIFKIKSNSVRKEINGVQVLFVYGDITFQHCNTNTASYSTGENKSFSVTSVWIGTYMHCQIDYDQQIISLFSDSVRYEFRDNGFAFFDSQSKQLVEIQRLR